MKDKEDSESSAIHQEGIRTESAGAPASHVDLAERVIDAAEAALAEAKSRVRDLRHLSVSSVSSAQRGPLLNWAERLTSLVTDGLREAVEAAASSGSTVIPAFPPIRRFSLLQSAMDGFAAISACHVECSEGYRTDSGGRVFETSSEIACVHPQPMPASCVAILLVPKTRAHSSSRIIFLPVEDQTHNDLPLFATLKTQAGGEVAEDRPLRIAACPAAPQLFLLVASQNRRLHVRQYGLDGACLQSAELKDFRQLERPSAEDSGDEDHRCSEDKARCYEDARIEADSKQIVVFFSGSKASIFVKESQVVVLLDRKSLRVVQRLQLPQSSWALHATPRLLWLRQAGQLKLVSQASRKVGHEWAETDCFGPGGLFYAADAAELAGKDQSKGGARLAVASENCVRLFDKEMRCVGRIPLRYPAAVCCVNSRLLAVCDSAAHEVLLFRL